MNHKAYFHTLRPLQKAFLLLVSTYRKILSELIRRFADDRVLGDNDPIPQQRSVTLTRNLLVLKFYVRNFKALREMSISLVESTNRIRNEDLAALQVVITSWKLILDRNVDQTVLIHENDKDLFSKLQLFYLIHEQEYFEKIASDIN